MAFGVYHANSKSHPNQWQWLMITVSILSFVAGILFMWRFPNNPPTAKFLSDADKVKAIKRIQANQNGIETKVWKKSQCVVLHVSLSALNLYQSPNFQPDLSKLSEIPRHGYSFSSPLCRMQLIPNIARCFQVMAYIHT
jgi:hypothetical protein